jgi:hypothetical protein
VTDAVEKVFFSIEPQLPRRPTSVAAFGGASGKAARRLETLNLILLSDFGAVQHGQHTAVLTYKCSISYSIAGYWAAGGAFSSLQP